MASIQGFTALLAHRRSRGPLLVLLVVAPILALLPHMRSLISKNAVVTAFVYTARAPISGRVSSLPARSGTVIRDGKAAAYVEDPRADDELIHDLQSRQRSQRDLVSRLENQRRLLDDLVARASTQLEGYRKGFAIDTEQRIASLRAELEGLEARLVEERHKVARARSLREQGMTSSADLESAEASLRALEADRDARSAERKRLETVSRELETGRVLVQGPEEAVRLEEELGRLRLERIEVETNLVRARSELAALAARSEPAEKRFGIVRRAPVEVPDGVVVYRIQTYEGEHVEAGAAVFSFVDCRELLLDMRVDDSVLSLVKEGQASRFRVFGSRRRYDARALLVRGSAAVIGAEALATSIPRGSRDGQVLSRIQPGPELSNASDFCGIGRTAYTKLDGIGLYREFLRRLFL